LRFFIYFDRDISLQKVFKFDIFPKTKRVTAYNALFLESKINLVLQSFTVRNEVQIKPKRNGICLNNLNSKASVNLWHGGCKNLR